MPRYARGGHYVYTLRLQGGRRYVGSTSNINQRLNKHFSGRGSQWTQRYHPVAVESVQRCRTRESSRAAERIVYRNTSAYHGRSTVRGAGYTRSY